MVKEEKRTEVVEEVRLEVDALMREELKNLKAVCDDHLIGEKVIREYLGH